MEARKTMQAIVSLPHEVATEILGYLGLFRPAQRALSWKAALRIMQELSVLIDSGQVRVQGKPSRPCPPEIWATGMRQMVAQRGSISRPLHNHNYLRQVAWQLADQADANRELQQEQDERSGWARAERQQERQAEQPEPAPPLTEAEKQALKRLGMEQVFQRLKAAQTNRGK